MTTHHDIPDRLVRVYGSKLIFGLVIKFELLKRVELILHTCMKKSNLNYCDLIKLVPI